MQRIRGDVMPGSGDDGRSNTVTGARKPKSSKDPRFYASVEMMQATISEIIFANTNSKSTRETILNLDLLYTLCWLEKALHSCQSFYHCLGSKDHAFPHQFRIYLFNTVKELWEKYGESKDFQTFNQTLMLIRLNKLRIYSREIEHHFCVWEESPELVSRISKNTYLKELVRKNRQTWNRLSSYFWVVTNRERESQKIPPNFWGGKMPDFISFIKAT